MEPEHKETENYSLVNSSYQKLSTAINTTSVELAIANPLVEAWVYWLAADVVSQWRSLPAEEYSLESIFEELNPELDGEKSNLFNALTKTKNNNSFLEELDKEVEKNYQLPFHYFTNRGIVNCLLPSTERLTNYLTTFLSNCLEQLKDNFDDLQPQLHQKQQAYFYLLKTAGTKITLNYLENLSREYNLLLKRCQLKLQENSDKTNDCKKSFEILSAQVFQWWEFSKQKKAEAVLNALLLSYKYQLLTRVYNVVCELLTQLESQLEQHILIVREVDYYLELLQTSYLKGYALDAVTDNFLKCYLSPKVNVQEVEKWLDSKYNFIKLNDNELLHLKQEILIHLKPYCFDFYTECFQLKKN